MVKNLNKDIIVAVVSALIGGVASLLGAGLLGFFNISLDKHQARLVASELITNVPIRDTLYDEIFTSMIDRYPHKFIQPGIVMAFDGADCPKGWRPLTELSGRVILGSGKGETTKIRSYKDRDGHESTYLSERNLPSHTHDVQDSFYHDEAQRHINHSTPTGDDGGGLSSATRTTTSSGLGEPFSIMPPFYVMPYCVKTDS